MSDRLLTQPEIDFIDKTAIEGDIVPYLEAQDTKTANYYETVVIPEIKHNEYLRGYADAERIAKDQIKQAKQELIEEIEAGKETCDSLTYETGRSICPLQQDDDCNNSCRFMADNCRWWQQLKQKRGK